MISKHQNIIKHQKVDIDFTRTLFIVLVLLLSTIASQWILISIGSADTPGSDQTNNELRNECNIIIDSAILTGAYNGEKGIFTLNYSFYLTKNGSIEIPLIGPSQNAMAINLTVDETGARIQFKKDYYYFLGELSEGEHQLIFKFSSNILADDVKAINYNLFGPALNYNVDFTISTSQGREIYIFENGNAVVFEEEDAILLKWEFYAIENINWNFQWTEYIVPVPKDIKCGIISEVLIEDNRAIIDVCYEMEFQGFGLDEISFELNDQTILKSTDKGALKSTAGKGTVKFIELIQNQITLNLTFEIRFLSELELIVPKPMNCNFTGDLAIFSEPDIMVQLLENLDAILTGYPGDIKPNTNFIGSYIFLDTSKLSFKISRCDTKITADIIDILVPTFEGYDIETWIYFNFYGNSPNSITIDFPGVTTLDNLEKPQILVKPGMPFPIQDYNWDSDLQRLIVYPENNLSIGSALGLRRSYMSNNVYMAQLTIYDVQIVSYYVAHYSYNGIVFKNVNQNGLQIVHYNVVPEKLRAHLQSDTNIKLFKADEEYEAVLILEKTTSLEIELFFRNWISETGININQIVRITSENSMVNVFTFSIPSNVISIDVHSSASWTIYDDTLVVYTKKSETKITTFNIDAEIAGNSGSVTPFMPIEINDCEIFTMFGSDSKLNLTIEPHQAESMNPDELPEYFIGAINTPKAITVFYSTEEQPTFIVSTNKYEIDEPPTTVIELAYLTIITSIDRKIAVQALYMVKNVDRLELHVDIPPGGLVWMVLVGGKSIPIIQHNNILTITLIRSTLTGENIAFPVEIVYLIIEPKLDLEFIMPTVDIPILELKINIGLSSSIYIIDPETYNPNFEFEDKDKWGSYSMNYPIDDKSYSDYRNVLNSQFSRVSNNENYDKYGYIYVGLNASKSSTDIIDIERLDAQSGEQIKFSVDLEDASYNSDKNMKFYKISVLPGQYTLSNSGTLRQITVKSGTFQQIIFDFNEELVFTGVPPIYLQFPDSGQVLSFSRIFIKPGEDLQIKLIEGEPEDKGARTSAWLNFESQEFLKFIVFSLIIMVIILFIVVKRSSCKLARPKSTRKRQKKPKKLKKKNI